MCIRKKAQVLMKSKFLEAKKGSKRVRMGGRGWERSRRTMQDSGGREWERSNHTAFIWIMIFAKCKLQIDFSVFLFLFVYLLVCIWFKATTMRSPSPLTLWHALMLLLFPFFFETKKTNDKNIYTQFLFYSLSIVIMMMPQNIMTFLSSLSLSRSPSCFVFLTKDSFVHKL